MSNGSIGIQMVSATAGPSPKSPPHAANNNSDAGNSGSSGPATSSAPAEGTGLFLDKTA
jgi:hypothetical protein